MWPSGIEASSEPGSRAAVPREGDAAALYAVDFFSTSVRHQMTTGLEM